MGTDHTRKGGTEKKGIVAWNEKWSLTQRVLSAKILIDDPAAPTSETAVAIYIDPQAVPNSQDRLAILDTMRKWHRSRPSAGNKKFIISLLSKLGVQGMSPESFYQCTFEEFKRSIPQCSQNYHALELSNHLDFSSVHQKWLEKGCVDQKYMYWNIDAFELWQKLAYGNDLYNTHKSCEESLSELFKSPAWKELKDNHHFSNIVILGAGSPKKEWKIVRDFIRKTVDGAPHLPQVLLIDASPYMLVGSERGIQAEIRYNSPEVQLDIQTKILDFAHVGRHEEDWFQRLTGQTAYFLPGGTFGNNDEDAVVDNLRSVMLPGDIFVVKVDFVDENDIDSYKSALKESYNSTVAKRMALAPLQPLLDDEGVQENYAGRLNKVEIDVVDGCGAPIPGTVGVVFQYHLEHKNTRIKLVSSKKYSRTYLLEYFSKKGFKPVENMPEGNQLVFSLS